MDPRELAQILREAIEESLAPLVEELRRIRGLLEVQNPERERSEPGGLPPPGPATASTPPPATDTDPAPPSKKHPTAAKLLPVPNARTTFLRELLSDYPDDAAAVYYAFDRQHRCAPEEVDRMAWGSDLETAWIAANRTTVLRLVERHRGGLNRVAEMLARGTDSLRVLIERIGLREEVESIRSRERQRIGNASLAERLQELLFREKLLRDLGILDEVDAQVRREVRELCAQLSGSCVDATEVLDRLALECRLDAAGQDRLDRRHDLSRFVSDLYRELTSADAAPRRMAARHEPARHLGDAEIETRILRMLLGKGKVGAAHTHIAHLVRTVPRHERGRARIVIDRMLQDGTLVLKTTDNSAEPHISIAVSAVRAIEERLDRSS